MLNCQAATRLLSESQERKLTLKETMALKLHTLMCKGCRNFGKHLQVLRTLARSYAKGEGAAKDLPIGPEIGESTSE
jgi:hypothetical protein